MELSAPVWIDLGGALIGAVIGLFIGFSGALAFLFGTAAAVGAAYFSWEMAADFVSQTPLRALAVGLLALVVFGAVRWVVRKCVHGIVAQPGDSIFGALLCGGTIFVLVEYGWKFVCKYL